jgi:hypothetical protein
MAVESSLAITHEGSRVVLTSPAAVFTLDTADGLRAVSWANRLTGRVLQLGHGQEVAFDIGLPEQPVRTPTLAVIALPTEGDSSAADAVFVLESPERDATVTVRYRLHEADGVLRKSVVIANTGQTTWDRLLNVRLGDYATGDASLTGGELKVYPPSFEELAHRIGGLQGFPVYAEDEFFLSLAHPAGCATQEPGCVQLAHYPGVVLRPGEQRPCMESVYGVGQAGGGREAFVAHVRSRMRRVRRGHDRPYAIFEPFGGRRHPDDDSPPPPDAEYADTNLFEENEAYLLDMFRKVEEGQREAGPNAGFDLTSLEFWVDNRGDIKRADAHRFPNQFETLKAALEGTGIALGLWLDSSTCGWSIGGNPDTLPAISQDVDESVFELDPWQQWDHRHYFCRATEPVRSLYLEGFLHHVRNNGVRLLKFDNFNSQCSNPNHDHLPGLWGNEATHEALIEFYDTLDAACPDLFIMLYWGYRSPWWLLHADTLFETGVHMEAASPGHLPAPFIRDGVTRKLDQGRRFAKDLPWLGADTLGVWLSHWGTWNSGVGTERWQEGMVMDICRGHALAQPWTDPDWLNPAGRRQMHEMIALMKAQPDCFMNVRPILGDPWQVEPYGYACSDGTRAFLAINNGTWQDQTVTLQLGESWGLPAGGRWDVYRWYPSPAKLAASPDGFGSETSMAMRPFEVVLLEVVPHGDVPTLDRPFAEQPIPVRFAESSCPVPLTVDEPANRPGACTITGELPASEAGGVVAVTLELFQDDGSPLELHNLSSHLAAEMSVDGRAASVEPAIGPASYPTSWQTWRLPIAPGSPARVFTLRVTDVPGGEQFNELWQRIAAATRTFAGHFVVA